MKYPDVMMEIDMQEVATMTSDVEQPPVVPREFPRESLEEQARRIGAKPFKSVDDLRDERVWESDEELAEFLKDLEFTRRTGCACTE